ncbi:MAG TPA: hypothetical protein VF407_17935 [Polyangiaceae bacterium]
MSPLLLVFVACGGEVSAVGPDGGASGHGSTASAPKSIDDGWDGGLIGPTPGTIRCGDTDCDKATQDCCIAHDVTPATNGCAKKGQIQCNGTQVRRECDEEADCNPDEFCCAADVEGLPVSIGMYCVNPKLNGMPPGCGLGELVACSSDADCDAVGQPACVSQVCRGNVLQTCGLLPSSWCD